MIANYRSEHHVYKVADVVKSRHIAISTAGVKRGGVELVAEHRIGGGEKIILLSRGETYMTFRLARKPVAAEHA